GHGGRQSVVRRAPVGTGQGTVRGSHQVQPTLAEAHYNLALVIEILGDGATARRHYIEAANLAPGHKVIWDSPPLRRHGLVDSTPKSDTLTTPSQSRHEP